eukprot:TRINITY_DN96728_c0_g1_i1.p1 TRINITY_DN96728_c0_g1~~TRINITY_DN96728_c0_g1_i1.p1  ORF type:complete len:119 (-),score=21.47 TRINITY_DN96728_c0_g1_i1:134-490(-)
MAQQTLHANGRVNAMILPVVIGDDAQSGSSSEQTSEIESNSSGRFVKDMLAAEKGAPEVKQVVQTWGNKKKTNLGVAPQGTQQQSCEPSESQPSHPDVRETCTESTEESKTSKSLVSL